VHGVCLRRSRRRAAITSWACGPRPERRVPYSDQPRRSFGFEVDFQSGIDSSVFVPTYRGAESLRELVARTQALFAERGLSGEIVLVKDVSPASDWSVVGELMRDQSRHT